MKPKTKIQKEVFALSQKLPAITEKQKDWGFEHCFEHIGYKTKKNISCLDCGHQWEDKQPPLLTSIDGCICPNCETSLKIHNTRKSKNKQTAYYSIITSFKGYQVVRFFDIYGYYKKGEKARYACSEIVQRWFAPNGKDVTIAKLRSMFAMYNDAWDWCSDLEIRPKTNATCYNLQAYKTYPYRSFIPEIKRNGFKGRFHGISVSTLFSLLLNNPKVETLIKAGQYDMLKYCTSRLYEVERYWPSIKICLRNNYTINDASIWIDYLRFLQYFDKDIRNARYVCPENLHEAHNVWMRKKQRAEEKREVEERRIRALKDEDEFKKLKGKFFGIAFTDGEIEVKVLESVLDYLNEGAVMHHCVGGYALRKDSLVFSAQIAGARIETVEVSLLSLKVVQCRGVCNKNTEHHDRIISLVNDNMHLIKERIKPKRKRSAQQSVSQFNQVAV